MTTKHYSTRQQDGRWHVVHTVPGTGVLASDADCATLAAAERLAAHMEAERQRELEREAQMQRLLGLRWGRLA